MHRDPAHGAGPEGDPVERERRHPAGLGRAERPGGRRDERRGDRGRERREGERGEAHVDPETRHREPSPTMCAARNPTERRQAAA